MCRQAVARGSWGGYIGAGSARRGGKMGIYVTYCLSKWQERVDDGNGEEAEAGAS